jgi:medium-chain acyl-[acyl-carrier-protein] hydrolase
LKDLQSLNGTPKEVFDHPELMAMVLPMLRADFQIVQTYAYTPEPPLNCPISIFGGLEDLEVSHEELNAWREQTVASCSIRMLEGDHFFLRSSQALLLQMISRILDNLVAGLSRTSNYR